MVPDVRSSGGNDGREFDVDSATGVVLVLAAIRGSDISQAQRNELRDLVFLYKRGGDQQVKLSLLAQLQASNITPSLAPATAPKSDTNPPTIVPQRAAVTTPSLIQSRPIPRFTLSAVRVPTKATVVPVRILPNINQTTVSVPPHFSEPVPEPLAVPLAVNQVASSSLTSEATVLSSRLLRIQEIKSAVNAAFGNPVNLVDIDNVLGREYMSALLEAMKLTAAADASVEASVMNRLESIFAKVKTLAGGAEVAYPVLNKATPVSSLAGTVSVVVPADTIPVITPAPLPPPPVMPTRIIPVPVRMRDMPDPSVTDISLVSAVSPLVQPQTPMDSEPIVTVGPITGYAEPAVTRLQSVADTGMLKTLADLPSADALDRSSVEGDDLFTNDVDDGLNQLLSEWTLFKKSGLFGTGPQGRNHPLFKKLAGLQIPLIMSGRFEGSSEEIKQSVSDYMNGWRYEQGIIIENNETFEHYLRRVIRHIINLQKKRRSS